MNNKFYKWVCLIASVLVIGTTVSGWVTGNDKKDTGNDTQVETTVDDDATTA